jgi:hypothetical protein
VPGTTTTLLLSFVSPVSAIARLTADAVKKDAERFLRDDAIVTSDGDFCMATRFSVYVYSPPQVGSDATFVAGSKKRP